MINFQTRANRRSQGLLHQRVASLPDQHKQLRQENTAHLQIANLCHTQVVAGVSLNHVQQSHQKCNEFHVLPIQQAQALLTLFSKSFSSFPYGTCLLSVSNAYLALDTIYHPFSAPIPRNATHRKWAVHKGLQMTHGILTLTEALFQECFTCASVGNISWSYNSVQSALIIIMSFSLFIRHYLGNPI